MERLTARGRREAAHAKTLDRSLRVRQVGRVMYGSVELESVRAAGDSI